MLTPVSLARVVLASTLALASFAHAAPATAPHLDAAQLQRTLTRIAERVRPGTLAVGVELLESGESVYLEGDRAMPMQSVFKAPLAAAVLEAADRGAWPLDSTVTLTRAMLSVPFSSVTDTFPQRTRWTWREFVELAAGVSDNTAADLLLERLGGPAALTHWLTAKGVQGITVARYERVQQMEILGLPAFRPEWSVQESLDVAKTTVPRATQFAHRDDYLRDPKDTMTPRGAVAFLRALLSGTLLAPAPRAQLLAILTASPTGPGRLRAGLPHGAPFAHKTGTGPTILGVCTAVNDIGIVTLPNGAHIAIAALYSGTTRGPEARERVLADVARAVVRSVSSR